MNGSEKSELNKPQVQLTSDTLERRLFSVYLQFLVERMPKICEVVIVAKGGHFDELKV